MFLSEKVIEQIKQALKDEYFEGAVEAVFKAHPECTRDEAVDAVEKIEMQLIAAKE